MLGRILGKLKGRLKMMLIVKLLLIYKRLNARQPASFHQPDTHCHVDSPSTLAAFGRKCENCAPHLHRTYSMARKQSYWHNNIRIAHFARGLGTLPQNSYHVLRHHCLSTEIQKAGCGLWA